MIRQLLPRYSWLGRFLRRRRDAFRAKRPHGRRYSEAELLAAAEEFNRNAETYWKDLAADPAAREASMRKPFATVEDASSILYRLGIVLSELRLGVGHTVLDLGAGACWLSAYLNRLGARTVAVDVSPTALQLGRDLFRIDPRQRLDLDPQFLVYDGHRLPLPDASVDRVVSFDAFHHVPNESHILGEIFRVLRDGGRAVFAEPGEGHSHTGQSAAEAERFHVLENELDLEAVARTAKTLGFTDMRLKPYPGPEAVTVSPQEYFRFMEGRDLYFPIDDLRRALPDFYIFTLEKGSERVDSRNPRTLRATIVLAGAPAVRGAAADELALTAAIENTGDTLWLHSEATTGGYVRLGVHLLDANRGTIDWNFARVSLPADVAAGASVSVEARIRLPGAPGRYILRFDMVDEGITWFEQRGSPVTETELIVQ
jgi:SAM-dependent methyltransferase